MICVYSFTKKNIMKLLLFYFVLTVNFSFCQTNIIIQPSGNEGKDAHISSRYPNFNGAESDHFDVLAWTNGGIEDIYRQLIAFDLSSIPPTATVNNATLTLFHNPQSVNTSAIHQSLSGSNSLVLQKLISPWDEYTVTWSNQPTPTTINQIFIPQSTSASQDYIINVTSLIQDAVSNPATNFGFLLKLQNEQYYRSVILASSDNPDSLNHPKLEISYTNELSISEINTIEVLCYPNPLSGDFINIASETGGKVSIHNNLGEQVINDTFIDNSGIIKMNVSQLSSGIYYVKVVTDIGAGIERIVIQ